MPLAGLDMYDIAANLSGEMLRPLLETRGDMRMHVTNGAVASFVDTLPLLHPFGRLVCHDLFVTDIEQYHTGFRGPGKYDGSVVNWVNGPLLRAHRVPAGLRRAVRTVRAPQGHEHRHDDRAGAGLMTNAPGSTLLPTTVVGSYSVPEWLERLKTDFYQSRLSHAHLQRDPRDRDQGRAQGPGAGRHRRRLRRRAAPRQRRRLLPGRLPGVEIAHHRQVLLLRLLRQRAATPLPQSDTAVLGLAEDYRFTAEHTDRPIKFSFTGPFSLSRRLRNEAYPDTAELVRALARILNTEAHALARAGATLLQIDEPFLAGYPEQVELAVEAINLVTKDVDVTWGLHVCYGNRYARPSWEGHYDFLFPAVLDAQVDQLVLEFARKGYDDLALLKQFGWDRSARGRRDRREEPTTSSRRSWSRPGSAGRWSAAGRPA